MRSVLCCLYLLVAVNASAEPEYWVSVASTGELGIAERIQREAGERLAEPFSLEPADTHKGFYYRVMTGPFFDLDRARRLLADAQRAGFDQAWVVPREGGEYSLGNFERTEVDDVLDTPSDYRLSDPLPDLVPERSEREPSEHQLIEDAPEGYRLNRLRRNQSLNWLSSPFLLADNNTAVTAAALAAAQAGGVEVDFETGDVLRLDEWDHKAADIKIDGRIDEPAWEQSLGVNLMRVIEPDTLAEPAYDTIVRVLYTQRGIYVSFDMEQPQETLVKRLSFRDRGRLNRDSVSFTLDTSGEGRYAYWMSLALGDTQVDGTALPERQYSVNWDGAWYGATTETEWGWSAEFFVPWSQMTMPKAEGVRRLGFYSSRQVAHLNQRFGWPPLPRSQAKFMSVLQPLEVENIDPRQQWSFFPYTSSTYDDVGDDTDYQAGFDLFWRPSTNFQVTSTVNPDFGTVEADDVVVNLSAFEVFFPERRLFFLEGREIFQETPKAAVDGRGTPVTLLNTRRIGSSPDLPQDAEDADEEFSDRESQQLTELYGAAKVTGQVGRVRYGVLTAFEKDTNLNALSGEEYSAVGRDYGVARALYEDTAGGEYRAVGLMSTVTALEDTEVFSNGLDYHYLSNTGVWKVDGQFLHSHRDQDGHGFGGFVDIVMTPRQGLRHSLELTHFEDDLEINELGFLRRNDVTGGAIRTEWIRSDLTRIRDFTIEPFFRYEVNGDGRVVRSGLGSNADFTFNNLSELGIEARFFPTRYDDRNSFGNGTYKIQDRPSFEVSYSTDSSKKLSYFAGSKWEREASDEGYLYEGFAGFSWRPVDRLAMEVSAFYRVRDGWLIHQEDRNMTAFESEEWAPTVEMDFFLSANQQFKLAFQWVGIKAFEDKFYLVPEDPGDLIQIEKPDEETDNFAISSMNFQARYRWQIAPLSDLFVVYTKFADKDLPMDSFSNIFEEAWQQPLVEQLVVKLRYRLGT